MNLQNLQPYVALFFIGAMVGSLLTAYIFNRVYQLR